MDLVAVSKALGNERRLKIVEWLKDPAKHFSSATCDVVTDGVCVGLIEQKIGLSQSTVSQYLMQLKQADVITMQRCGQWTFCKLNPTFLKDVTSALQTLL